MEAAFGKIEECACCGRTVKKPVKWRGAYVGKACRDSLAHIRQRFQWNGLMDATKEAMTYHPRVWDRHLAMAIG